MAVNKEKLAADLIAQISKDPALLSKFQNDPMGTIKELAGTDLGSDVLGMVGDEFGVNMGNPTASAGEDNQADSAENAGDANGIMGMVGKLFGNK